jgi:hypothetical protein
MRSPGLHRIRYAERLGDIGGCRCERGIDELSRARLLLSVDIAGDQPFVAGHFPGQGALPDAALGQDRAQLPGDAYPRPPCARG